MLLCYFSPWLSTFFAAPTVLRVWERKTGLLANLSPLLVPHLLLSWLHSSLTSWVQPGLALPGSSDTLCWYQRCLLLLLYWEEALGHCGLLQNVFYLVFSDLFTYVLLGGLIWDFLSGSFVWYFLCCYCQTLYRISPCRVGTLKFISLK